MTKATRRPRAERETAIQIVYSAAVSLDGFIADRQGDVDWLHAAMVPGEGYGLREFMASVEAVLMGRLTYEKSLEMGGGGMGSAIPCWVFSRQPLQSRGAMTVTSDDPATVVAALRARGVGRAWLMGGGKLASSFLAAGLIDEIALGVMPVVLGGGIPLFAGGIGATKLELIEQKTYNGGALGLRYRPAVS